VCDAVAVKKGQRLRSVRGNAHCRVQRQRAELGLLRPNSHAKHSVKHEITTHHARKNTACTVRTSTSRTLPVAASMTIQIPFFPVGRHVP
jgi:hypothetical protein